MIKQMYMQAHLQEVAEMDVGSHEFTSLPPELQYDLLLEKRELEKHSHTHLDILPKVLLTFSYVI